MLTLIPFFLFCLNTSKENIIIQAHTEYKHFLLYAS